MPGSDDMLLLLHETGLPWLKVPAKSPWLRCSRDVQAAGCGSIRLLHWGLTAAEGMCSRHTL
jgi:hypothetical protein